MASKAPSAEVAETLRERAERIRRRAARTAVNAGRLTRQFDAHTMLARRCHRW